MTNVSVSPKTKRSFDSALDFDILAIKNEGERETALAIAKHTLAKLLALRASENRFARVLSEGILPKKELKRHVLFSILDYDFVRLAILYAEHADDASKEAVMKIAGLTSRYDILEDGARALRGGRIEQAEFLYHANHYFITNSTFDDTTHRILRDASRQHGKEFEERLRQTFQKRYDDWSDLPSI